MDIMDIQAVESKLSDVTVTPIPRSQVQNFYNYQQQREQREQQPQIQISAIHHTPRERHQTGHHSNTNERDAGGRDLYNLTKRERDYHHQLNNVVTNSNTSAAVAVAALQYTQKLQAQLALLQQQANNSVGTTPSITLTPASSMRSNNSISNSNSNQNSSNQIGQHPLQLKYPQSSSPVIITTQTSANITTPMTSTANLPTVGATGVNNGLSKYAQLLAVIEEMGRDIRPTYTGSRTSTERLKRGIVHARILSTSRYISLMISRSSTYTKLNSEMINLCTILDSSLCRIAQVYADNLLKSRFTYKNVLAPHHTDIELPNYNRVWGSNPDMVLYSHCNKEYIALQRSAMTKLTFLTLLKY
uniref:Uncharacterized protein n=1 Tax=Glossina pallidipes TaxID=7398 RepID=A0A1A9Z4P2_GLOPL